MTAPSREVDKKEMNILIADSQGNELPGFASILVYGRAFSGVLQRLSA
jgi:hypothetical protein